MKPVVVLLDNSTDYVIIANNVRIDYSKDQYMFLVAKRYYCPEDTCKRCQLRFKCLVEAYVPIQASVIYSDNNLKEFGHAAHAYIQRVKCAG